MEQRLSLVTLGVADVAQARRFYEALGWKAAPASQEGIAFFACGGMVLSLYGRAALAEDMHKPMEIPKGHAGIALAYNTRSRAEVDATLAEAVAAGATLLKAAEEAFWGGYSGYFADPDGHPWEVAFNPFWTVSDDGRIILEPPAT